MATNKETIMTPIDGEVQPEAFDTTFLAETVPTPPTLEPTEQPILEENFKKGDLVHQKDPKTLAHIWHGKVTKVEGSTVFLKWEEFDYKEPLQYEASQLAIYG